MEKILRFAFAVVMSAACADAATISNVKIKQLWPWSTDIRITYCISDVGGPTDVRLECYDGGVPINCANLHNAVIGDICGIDSDGEKTITLDPVKAFGTAAGSYADFNVELTPTDSPANGDEVIYKIFDLDANTCENVTRNDLKNGRYGDYEKDYSRIGNGFNTTLSDVLIWTAVTNGTEYKTDKLVMRKIPAAGTVWNMGSGENELGSNYMDSPDRENRHAVRLTEDYFMSVFEVTQAQFAKFYGIKGGFTNESDSAIRPVESCDYAQTLRGMNNWLADDGSASAKEWVYWPTNAYRHCVRYNRVLGIMRKRMGVKFDLPTEAQWEFACRAGSTNALYSGKEMITVDNALCDRNVDEIAWTVRSDYSDAPGGTNQTRAVGLKKPNAFGLYDMAGNVSEWCLDWYYADVGTFYDKSGDGMADIEHADPLVDPVGRSAPSGTDNLRSARGGNWTLPQRYTRSAYRMGIGYTQIKSHIGFRIVCPAADDWK